MQNIQKNIQIFCEEHNLNATLEHRLLDLASEVGELSKEVLNMTDYGKKTVQFQDNFQMELGDVFYTLITIANYFELDLEETLHKTLDKYRKRLVQGSMGSENN